MTHVLAFDAAWGGVGWTLANTKKPLATGWFAPGNKTWRTAALAHELRELDRIVARFDVRPRVVVERINWHYHAPGNQRPIAFGLGTCAGAIELWGCREEWPYPWLVPVAEWRKWWAIKGRGKAQKKQCAITYCTMMGWGHFLAEHRDIDKKGDGARGDVAESILIGVGAARRPLEAPAGPAKWRAA